MPVGLIKDIKSALQPDCDLLGLDVGSKTIGIAHCSGALGIATPVETLKRVKFTQDAAALAEVIRRQGAGALVIGLPINMDGSAGPRAQSVRDFALELHKWLCERPDTMGTDPWIGLWDERLSTRAVEDFVDNVVSKRKTKAMAKQSGLIDKLAAQHILQGAVDYLKNKP